MRQARGIRTDERGGTLVIVAVCLVVLLAMIALAVDLSMGFTARGEAQRVADASALAGASAFLDYNAAAAEAVANDRAVEYATANVVRNDTVAASEVTVQVLTDSLKVRVWIVREGLPTWFARLLGVDDLTVSARAAAVAASAGSAKCLKPIALPDAWADADDDDNGNRVWDEEEQWEFGSDPGDRYERYSGGNSLSETGYGSQYRDPTTGIAHDYGRRLEIKPADPNDPQGWGPGWFFPWALPPDPDLEGCKKGGGSQSGGALYRANICSCNNNAIHLGQEYLNEPGNMVGPTFQGVSELMGEDPDAVWDPSANGGEGGVTGSDWGDNWISSPRVMKIAVFDPGTISDPGRQPLVFNNFALLFLEGQQSMHDPVVARFLYYATGEGEGPVTGPLVRVLRLVE